MEDNQVKSENAFKREFGYETPEFAAKALRSGKMGFPSVLVELDFSVRFYAERKGEKCPKPFPGFWEAIYISWRKLKSEEMEAERVKREVEVKRDALKNVKKFSGKGRFRK